MQILNTSQIHAWDEYTMRHEPVSSIDLMERAARSCFNWLLTNGYQDKNFSIFCGKGNNGGDGLAIGRMLANSGHQVFVYILEFGHKGTEDFQHNLALLHETTAEIIFISGEDTIREINDTHVVIDALLGSGLNRKLEGLTASVVNHINRSGNEVISIDIPTGMFTDRSEENTVAVKANHTLTFQSQKLSFLLSENQQYIGTLHILNIGLHPDFLNTAGAKFHLTDEQLIKSWWRPRKKFSHKGDYGSGGLIAGSVGMMGAATLAARAFMRSGAGKLTCHLPAMGYNIMQIGAPEVMAKIEPGENHLLQVGDLSKYDAIAIGPGLGLFDTHNVLLADIFSQFRKPVVLDADALNVLSGNASLFKKIPGFSILTPHHREFDRLFGKNVTDYSRIVKALEKAAELSIILVLKGPHTFIALPDGTGYFNSTGNAGMATGGAGDVLTGIIAGLLCQSYEPSTAAIAGVYFHGLAGDLAAAANSKQALIASDIYAYLGQAFKTVE